MRSLMWTRIAACLAVAMAVPATAAAQDPQDEPPVPRITGIVWGGEVSAALARKETGAYFNYTDYEHDALRHVRLRFMAESRLPGRLDLLGELRTDDQTVTVPALFLRWQPASGLPFYVQAGRIPQVIGAFSRRAYGSDNLLVGIPLAYQYLTSLRPDALPLTADDLLRMRGRGWRPSYPLGSDARAAGLPLLAFSRGDVGIEAQWSGRDWTAAGAVTLGTPADPRWRDNNDSVTVSGRVALQRPSGLTVGVSAAQGAWIGRSVGTLLTGPRLQGTSQRLLGVDAGVALGHWIVRGELWRARFEVPTLASSLVATAAFIEGRYRLHPRWQVAARADRLTFSSLTGSDGVATPWEAPVWRLEGVVGYRVSRRLDLRAGWQHNWREAGRVRERGSPVAQAILWF